MRKQLLLIFASAMIFLTLLIEAATFLFNRYTVLQQNTRLLKMEIADLVEIIEYDEEDEEILVDESDLEHGGISMTIYDEEGVLLLGTILPGLEDQIQFNPNHAYSTKIEGRNYLIYDYPTTVENQKIYIKAVYAIDPYMNTFQTSLAIFLVTIPIIALLTILITAKLLHSVFEPVNELSHAAITIADSSDLKQRLPVGSRQDELYELSTSLNRMLDQLEVAFERERQFSGDISHEIKTPLSAVLLECENALKHKEDLTEETIVHIQSEIRRLMKMINQLLMLSRSISKDDILQMEDFDLSLVVEETISQYQELYPETLFETLIAQQVYYNGDPSLIMQVLINLFNNSIRYQEPSRYLWITVTLEDRENEVFIRIEDNGIGIKEENLSKIFQRFYQEDKNRNREGFGLGLSMVKWIVEAHKGSVEVESTYGQGTSFTIVLPRIS